MFSLIDRQHQRESQNLRWTYSSSDVIWRTNLVLLSLSTFLVNTRNNSRSIIRNLFVHIDTFMICFLISTILRKSCAYFRNHFNDDMIRISVWNWDLYAHRFEIRTRSFQVVFLSSYYFHRPFAEIRFSIWSEWKDNVLWFRWNRHLILVGTIDIKRQTVTDSSKSSCTRDYINKRTRNINLQFSSDRFWIIFW